MKAGDPSALDELAEEICGDDPKPRREFSEILADEYRRCYKELTDTQKDGLLVEIVESMTQNETRSDVLCRNSKVELN